MTRPERTTKNKTPTSLKRNLGIGSHKDGRQSHGLLPVIPGRICRDERGWHHEPGGGRHGCYDGGGLTTIAERISRPWRIKSAHRPATTRSRDGGWATVFKTD